MYALISLIIIISLSLLIVRMGTVALVMTGMSESVASFQSLSAFSGAGFTTEEAENVLEYPSRRAIVKTLIRLGSVGLITSISSLVLSFTDPATRADRLVILTAAAIVLVALSRSEWFNRLLTPVIETALRRIGTMELQDYTNLLQLHRNYAVADLTVSEGDWLANESLDDLGLRATEGITILGIRRSDGTYIGAPSPEHEIKPGDTVVAYGQADRLEELVDRAKADRAAHEDAKADHRRMQAREREIDPERSPVYVT